MSKNNILLFISFVFIFTSCNCNKKEVVNFTQSKEQINTTLDNWHKDVATFKYDSYFKAMDNDAVFIGTDASEIWTKQEFQKFAKPYFDKNKTWNFSTITRNIYLSEDGKIAWFDELLNTQMKICRGSGVLIKKDTVWKIKQYVLSLTIPNDSIKSVIFIKSKNDSIFNRKFNNKTI